MRRTAMLAAAVAVAALMAMPVGPAAADEENESSTMMQPQRGYGQGMMGGGYGRGMMGQGYGMMGPQSGGPQGPGYGYGPRWDDESDWHEQMHQWMQQRGYPGYGYHMGPGMGRGYGMMGPGMMYGPGQGYGMGTPPCHMGPGMMYGPGPWGGRGMGRGYGMMGPGMMYGPSVPDRQVTAEDVRAMLERRLEWRGNPNLKVGKVEAQDDRIVAEIVTQDDSLVRRFEVDPQTGRWMPVN